MWDFIKLYAAVPLQIGKFDIVTGYFTLRALSKLYHEIPENVEYRLLSSELLKDENDEKNIIDLLRGDEGIASTFELEEYVRDAKAFLQRETVSCKAITNAFCHAKVYLYEPSDHRLKGFFLSGSSNLTDSGLGLRPSSNIELTMGKTADRSDADYRELSDWFNEIWANASDTLPVDRKKTKGERISVKEYFIRQIDDFFRKYTPEEIYYKILFKLFNADLELDASIEHRQDMSLLQTSTIWKTLFNYQQKGVISLIKMPRKYNGLFLRTQSVSVKRSQHSLLLNISRHKITLPSFCVPRNSNKTGGSIYVATILVLRPTNLIISSVSIPTSKVKDYNIATTTQNFLGYSLVKRYFL